MLPSMSLLKVTVIVSIGSPVSESRRLVIGPGSNPIVTGPSVPMISSARTMFSRPPDTTRPWNEGRMSTLSISVWRISTAEAFGRYALSSPTAPATYGDENEVPLMYP